MKKKVIDLAWSSLDGRLEFRPKYSDGSLGTIVQTQTELSDRNFAQKRADLLREWLGREAEA